MISPSPTELNTRVLCKDFIRMWKSSILDGISASMRMQDHWGIRLDWHEFSNVLDEMNRRGEVELVGHNRDGMTQYRVK